MFFHLRCNFLAAGQGGVRTAPIASGSTTGSLAVKTIAEAAENSEGRITAEILEGRGYALSADVIPRNAEAVVLDNLPEISLSVPESAREADGKFDITLTSNGCTTSQPSYYHQNVKCG